MVKMIEKSETVAVPGKDAGTEKPVAEKTATSAVTDVKKPEDKIKDEPQAQQSSGTVFNICFCVNLTIIVKNENGITAESSYFYDAKDQYASTKSQQYVIGMLREEKK